MSKKQDKIEEQINDMPDVEAERVEAEIVESIPHHDASLPLVKMEDLPPDAMPAPPAEMMFSNNVTFVKGGIPGPGRKRLYQTPQELWDACQRYFETCLCDTHNPATGRIERMWIKPPTIPGLARALGMTPMGLRNYQLSDEFGETVDAARSIIQEYLGQKTSGGGNQGGPIFLLKNMGLSDNRTVTYAPPSRLQAAKSMEEIAKLVGEDIVSDGDGDADGDGDGGVYGDADVDVE